ncbi:hypothetical protein PCE1_003033 [Barthelona sp. PCE]
MSVQNEKWPRRPIPNMPFTYRDYKPAERTMYEAFCNSVTSFNDSTLYGVLNETRDAYHEISYRQMNGRVNSFVYGLRNIFPQIDEDFEEIVIMGNNTIDWMTCSIGATSLQKVLVPLYTAVFAENLLYIWHSVKPRVVVVQAEYVTKTLSQLSSEELAKPEIYVILNCDEISDEIKAVLGEKAIAFNKIIHTGAAIISEIEIDAEEHFIEPIRITNADSNASIIFSSGTTGLPKGVVLTNRNILGTCDKYMTRFIAAVVPFRSFSYLPLSHVFGLELEWLAITSGGSSFFFSGDRPKLLEEIKLAQPTMFVSVPRVLDKIYAGILAKVEGSSSVVRGLFNRALNTKIQNIDRSHGLDLTHWLYDRIVFGKIRSMLGGKVKQVISGSAPLRGIVQKTLMACLSCPVVDGIGTTETSAGIASQVFPIYEFGNSGTPFADVELKLADCPEKGIFVAQQEGTVPGEWHWDAPDYLKDYCGKRGELWVRSDAVMKEYYHDPNLTKTKITEDGFYKTGDIVTITPNGQLRFVERVGNIFKTAQGEFINPIKIEQCLQACPLVANLIVVGSEYRSFLCAVVQVVDSLEGIPASIVERLDEDMGNVKDVLLEEFQKISYFSGLRPFEFVRNVHVVQTEFSVDEGTLTPSSKLVAKNIKKIYANEISEMFVPENIPLRVNLNELEAQAN